jgi:hypothetical protein
MSKQWRSRVTLALVVVATPPGEWPNSVGVPARKCRRPWACQEDTTGVPPLGEITMRTRFLDFPGRWVYHCHILLHEDNGMMGTVRALA